MATCTKGQLPKIKILNVVSGTFGLLMGNGTLGLLLELLTSYQLATAERLWFLSSHVLRTYWAGFTILETRTGRNDHTLSRWQESLAGGEICSENTTGLREQQNWSGYPIREFYAQSPASRATSLSPLVQCSLPPCRPEHFLPPGWSSDIYLQYRSIQNISSVTDIGQPASAVYCQWTFHHPGHSKAISKYWLRLHCMKMS